MPHGETLLIEVAGESWPLASPFVIARGAKLEANVIVAIVSDGHLTGRGEAVPYARYGETV
jgi:L-alanine-DL-glutamate epimerase-like enolase superfamily enzyme